MPAAPKLRQLATRFASARRGATAVEFAMIAGPLLLLIFGILELALVFMVSTTLETATALAARPIRTGELQTSGAASAENFKKSVCDRMSWLGSDCAENLRVEVRSYVDFTSVGQDDDPVKDCWAPGGPTDIVFVQTSYYWRIFTPLISAALVNDGSDRRRIVAVEVFRNEPYSDAPAEKGATC